MMDTPAFPTLGSSEGSGALDEDAELVRLARLSALEYGRARKAAAEQLSGGSVKFLDAAVNAKRAELGLGKKDDLQGHDLQLDPPEPWPVAVDGAALLGSLADFIERHVFLPPRAADAAAGWVQHTYVFECFRHTPRFFLASLQKRSGKTTMVDVLTLLVCKALPADNISAAGVFRTIEKARPTLLIDEADTFLRDNPELRGVVNAGHKRGAQVIRCVGDDAEPRAFDVFAPMAIAAIGRLFDTTEDRAIKVPMTRAKRDERPAMLDEAAEEEGERLARQCARWAQDNQATLQTTRPTLPPELFNRAADNWRPLFAIAEVAGGDWPHRIRAASGALAPDEDENRSIRLLADIKLVFGGADLDKDAPRAVDQMSSELLCERLAGIVTSPWGEYGRARKPMTQRQLATALFRAFKITPGTIRLASGKTPKGYRRAAFVDLWARYLDDFVEEEGVYDPPSRHTPTDSYVFSSPDPQQGDPGVADRNRENPSVSAACGGVADRIPPATGFEENDAAGNTVITDTTNRHTPTDSYVFSSPDPPQEDRNGSGASAPLEEPPMTNGSDNPAPAYRVIGPAQLGDGNCCECGQGGMSRQRVEIAGRVEIVHAACLARLSERAHRGGPEPAA